MKERIIMKRFIIGLLTILLLQMQVLAVNIPSGTPVIVNPQNLIDADDVREGDNVKFTVIQPVKVNDEIVINTGTEVTAKIIKRKNNGILGIPGNIEIGEFSILTPENEIIRLTGTVTDTGEGRYWANVGWIFIITLPIIFIKGNDAKIPVNRTFILYTI